MNIFICTAVIVSCGTVQHSCRLYTYTVYHITPCHDLLEHHCRNTETPSPFLVLSPHACRHPVALYWQPCTWLPTIVAWHTCVITVTTHDVSKRKFLWPNSNKTAVLKNTKHSSGNDIIQDYLRRKNSLQRMQIIWKTWREYTANVAGRILLKRIWGEEYKCTVWVEMVQYRLAKRPLQMLWRTLDLQNNGPLEKLGDCQLLRDSPGAYH